MKDEKEELQRTAVSGQSYSGQSGNVQQSEHQSEKTLNHFFFDSTIQPINGSTLFNLEL
jgi:hypothetical protein